MELDAKVMLQTGNILNETAEPPAPSRAGRRILIVDDNQDAADSLGALLGIMGNEVHIAYDGAQALEMAAHLEPHVVLMDIGLPKMDGYEAARQMRNLPGMRAALIVALTGWGQGEDRRRSREAGFDHHLVKPVALDDLQTVLTQPGRQVS